jgi:hypothetical protein
MEAPHCSRASWRPVCAETNDAGRRNRAMGRRGVLLKSSPAWPFVEIWNAALQSGGSRRRRLPGQRMRQIVPKNVSQISARDRVTLKLWSG